MLDMRVDTSIRDESEEMDFFVMGFCVVEGFLEIWFVFEGIFSYCFGYPNQILVNNTPSSQIGMSNFAIPHLSLWESYKFAIRA